MCPRCRQNAPLVYRGLVPYCSACGTMRVPLTGSSVNMAGRPSKLGGTLAKAIGWIVLAVGLSIALLLGLFFQWVLPAGFAGYAVGGVIALLTATFGVLLLRGGKSLQKSGDDEAQFTREKAIFALAAHRGGMLTANDAASALGIRAEEADSLLTVLAKTKSDQVSLELDDSGGIYYRFPAMLGWSPPSAVRVDPGVAPAGVASPPEGELLDAEVEAPYDARAGRPTR